MWVNVAAIANVASNILGDEKEKFNALSEEEKEQKFLSVLDEIKMNQDFQNFEKWWNHQSVKKKKQFYKDWDAISVEWSFNYATKLPWTLDVSKNPLKIPRVRWVPNPVFKHINPKKNIEESIETSVYESFPWLMRWGVDFWLLKKPWTMSKRTLAKNIATDANTLATNLWIFEKVCWWVPALMALKPVIQKLLPYAEWYKEHGAELMQEKIGNRKKKQVEKSTTYSLSHIEQNIVQSQVEWESSSNDAIPQDASTTSKELTKKDSDVSWNTTEWNTVATNQSWWLSENAW